MPRKPYNSVKQRTHWLKHQFGLTQSQYESLLSKQNWSCAICGITQEAYGKSFAVDHDHQTMKIRGLLCVKCNTGLGKFQDSKYILDNAIAYLVRSDEQDTNLKCPR